MQPTLYRTVCVAVDDAETVQVDLDDIPLFGISRDATTGRRTLGYWAGGEDWTQVQVLS